MDIHTLAVGGGPVPSLVVLRSRTSEGTEPIQLPIRIGFVEATAISMGLDSTRNARPMTHDLMKTVITSLGASLVSVAIVDVHGTTFYAELTLTTETGRVLTIDCRPSDAIALAVRSGVPIYADEHVLDAATLPDFRGIEKESQELDLERFHDFVETLSPADFDALE
jgi:bifunctional DNase/RNase